MNTRIRELEKQCWSHRVDGALVDGQLHFDTEKFAELIVRECVDIADGTRYDGKVVANRIKFVFGLEETQGWVCTKCGADRTKIACPLGFGAQVDGRCPMTAEAQ